MVFVAFVHDVVTLLVLRKELVIVFAAFHFWAQNLLHYVFHGLTIMLCFLFLLTMSLVLRILIRFGLFSRLFLINCRLFGVNSFNQKLFSEQFLHNENIVVFNILFQESVAVAAVVSCSETEQNLRESLVLLLHFLVVASTLLCFPSSHEFRHTCKYPVHPSQAAIHEMAMVDLKKPVVSFVFLHWPVSEQLVRVFLPLHVHAFVLFLLYFVCFWCRVVFWIVFQEDFFGSFRFGGFVQTLLI